MILQSVLFLCLLQFSHGQDVEKTEKFANCQLKKHQKAFEVLPGSGWDNLQNMEMGRVLALNYSNCRSSEDGKFLLSNGMNLIPLKKSYVELTSETFEHYQNYTSMTSRSINVEVSGSIGSFGASGSFSEEFQHVKSQQSQTKSTTTRVSQRHEKYLAIMQPDSPLSQEFLNRLLDIATYIIEINNNNNNNNNNNTLQNTTRMIDYLSDLVIRDFGTHVIRTVTAGALLSKVDHLNSDYVKKMENKETTFKAAAGASFGSVFKTSIEVKNRVSESDVDEYNHACSSSSLYTMGGPTAGANFSMDNWENHLSNNLVALDRHGDPIYYVITPRVLPSLPDIVVFQLAKHLEDAVNRYYSANSITGCMDLFSTNYNYMANIDNGECVYPVNNFTLGGIFQVCEGEQRVCGSMNQRNPATGDFSCSEGFEQVNLFRVLVDCRRDCYTSGILWWEETHCSQSCGYLSTSWCSPVPDSNRIRGFLMGGIFSDGIVKSPNPITGQANCPNKFFAVQFGMNHKLCLSLDSEMATEQSIPIFGGFYSCSAGNPFAADENIHQSKLKLRKSNSFLNSNFKSTFPARCDSGYSQVFAFVEGSCEVVYCIKSGFFKHRTKAIPLKRPPFVHLDFMQLNSSGPRRNYLTGSSSSSGWALDDNGDWKYLKSNFDASKYSSTSSSSSSTPIGIILSAVFGTLAMGILTIFAVYYFIKRRPLQMWLEQRRRRNYECLNEENESDERIAILSDEPVINDQATTSGGGGGGGQYGAVSQTENEVRVRMDA